jgi:hypothetical protein
MRPTAQFHAVAAMRFLEVNVYQQWAHGRQTCLAHLLRWAKGLADAHARLLDTKALYALPFHPRG